MDTDTNQIISDADTQIMIQWIMNRKETPLNITFKELIETTDFTLMQKLGISYTIGNMMGREKMEGRVVRPIVNITQNGDRDNT